MTKISQLSDIGANLAGGDEFVIRDVSDATTPNKKVTSSGIIDYVIGTGSVTGFTKISAGAGPLSEVACTFSGSTGTITMGTASAGSPVERLRIDSSGRLLLGASSARTNFFNAVNVPAEFLIETTGQGVEAAFIRNETDDNGAALILAKSKGSASGSNALVASGDNFGEIYFMGSDGSEFVIGGSVSCVVDGTPGANDMPGRLVFSTTADGSATPTERMRIDSSGRVGIGTSSPQSLLTLSTPSTGTSTESLRIEGGQRSSGSFATGFRVYTESTASDSNRHLRIICNGSTGFSIQPYETSTGNAAADRHLFLCPAGGRVGIGTSSPLTKIDSLVNTFNDDSTKIAATFRNNQNSGVFAVFQSAGTGTAYGDGLHIGLSNTSGGIINLKENTDLQFGVGNTERMRIDSSGRVGIGTSSPTYQLQLSTDSAGKPSTNTWTIVSDERIKEDVELADLDICYQTIKTIPLKRFKWKDEVYTTEQVPDRHKLGWIAQDVEPVFPKAVHIHEFKYNQVFEEIVIPAVEEELDEDGNVVTPAQPERTEKGELVSEEVIEDCRDLNVDQLYAAMYGAMQKLIQKVEILEAEVAALKGA